MKAATIVVLFALLVLQSESTAAAATITYYYTNPQGTPLATADASGSILSTSDYRPYGAQAMGTPTPGPGYTGHVNEADTDLVYMQARYYDPAVGRFLSGDPSAVRQGDLNNFNRYSYASDNPVVNADPFGRDTCPGSTSGSCRRADTWVAERSNGRTIQVDDATATAAKDAIGQIQTNTRPEVGGYIVRNSESGAVKFQRSTDATAGRDQKHDGLNLGPKPDGAVAVEHSHIDGSTAGSASKGLQSDGDAQPLTKNLPNIAESNGRLGAWELVGGRLQVRMLEGKMSHAEQVDIQKNLNNQQEQFLSQ